MPENTLGGSQNSPRTEAVQEGIGYLRATTRADAVREITIESERFGFPTLAEAVRTVMTVFARSPRVQEAVKRDLALGVLEPTKER